ncbi:extracellular matrix protein 1-like [Cololabis saira]|uniref:extracellular matrix protein 1-like n=1 Tax=Cololabis saira TaxID=129043 RepID=UPI002AD3B77E|nr:extracellular matrix protein 1-like [Cololabis saira]
MTSAGRLVGFWIIAVMTVAHLGETKKYSYNEPNVPFPPARPTMRNLANICHQGQGRPRYPDSFFPNSGASHYRRRGDAINRLESWYSLCCSGQVAQQVGQILCCAQQAWKHALSRFCAEEFSTMTLAYECCEDKGEARWRCFDSRLPNPNYSATPGSIAPEMPAEPGFTFRQDTC